MTDTTRGWMLAIDTSTERAGIALTDGERLFELAWTAGREQTVSVLAEIDHLISLAGIATTGIRAVAIAIGPGTFNGLRVGMSIAKGFVLGGDALVIGVSTLAVTARPFAALGTVVPVVAAGRGRLVWSRDASGTEPVNGTVEELVAHVSGMTGPVIVAGDLSFDQAALVAKCPAVWLPPASGRHRRPAALAELGWARYLAGEIDDAVELAPVYVHSTAQQSG